MIRVLKNLSILFRCYGRFLLFGRSRQMGCQPKTLLVFQGAKLGDMVCTTPVFRSIKKNLPNARLIVAGDKTNSLLLGGHPDIDDYIIVGQGYKGLAEGVRKVKPDFACLATPAAEVLAELYLSGVPTIVAPRVVGGWCPFQTILYRLLLPLVITVPHRFNHYAPGEYLKLLEPIGINDNDTNKHLTFSASARDDIDKLFLDNNLENSEGLKIGISPSAGNKIKNWGGDKFAALADYLFEKYRAHIFLVGSPRDQAEVEDMLNHLSAETKIINTSGQLNLDELKALISRLDLFISVDTGPIYIAEAFGVATVDILGPMNSLEQPPVGPHHVVVEEKGRIPQLHIMNAVVYDKMEAKRQIEVISVEMVRMVADELIKKIYAPREKV